VVTISATARSLHAALIGALSALTPRKLQLLYPDVPQLGDVAIRIDDNSAETARLRRLRVGVIGAFAALLIVSAAGFGYLGYTWQQASNVIAGADDAIADLRKKLAARGTQEPAAERDHAAILARKLQTPVSVTAVDALATVLPDDTWLTELRVADGHVRITGVSRNVAGLVPLIEANPAFAEASFFAPTTRLPDNQGDRFYLDARLVTGARR
jgi:general secretion pathway protein L